MRTRFFLAGAVAAALLPWVASMRVADAAAPQAANPLVRVELSSAQNGAVLAPGSGLEWRMRAYVSPGDNEGLALIAVDFAQDPTNPDLIDIVRGRPVTSTMRAFDFPDGFANLGNNLLKSGFGGTQTGLDGEKNLLQIGGAQNTFGSVPANLGPNGEVRRGQDVDVDQGVGQGVNGQLFATGNFRVPSAPGIYTFRASNLIANVIEQKNPAPQATLVRAADTLFINDTITFTVQ